MINIVTRELLKPNKSPTPSITPKRDSQQRPSSSASGDDSKGKPLFIFSTDHALIKDPKFLEHVRLYAQVI